MNQDEDPIVMMIRIIPEHYRTEFAINLKRVTPQIMHQKIDMIMQGERVGSFDKYTQEVINAVCENFMVTYADITGKKRDRNIKEARHVFMWAMRMESPLSFSSIGKMVNKDHATVIHACDNIDNAIGYDPKLRDLVKAICDKLEADGFVRCAHRFNMLINGVPRFTKFA
jgi:chromosomal replication initiator protein